MACCLGIRPVEAVDNRSRLELERMQAGSKHLAPQDFIFANRIAGFTDPQNYRKKMRKLSEDFGPAQAEAHRQA